MDSSKRLRQLRVTELCSGLGSGIGPALCLLFVLSPMTNSEALAQRTKNSALSSAGQSLVLSGKFRQAMPYFQKEIENDPKDPSGYLDRGLLLYQLEKPDEALQDLDQCIALKGNLVEAYSFKCRIYFERGQLDKALEYCNECLKYAPDKHRKSDELRTRGKIYCEMHQDQKALADFSAATALQPDIAINYRQRGNLYMHLKQYDKAAADYTKGLQYKSNDVDILHSLRAQAYEKLGRKDLAAQDRQKTNSSVMNTWTELMQDGQKPAK